MDKQEKSENQNAFISGEVPIMVATSAFGMGIDKKDVGMVIHYEISDSLENYIQEAGRAGRDENIRADCFILFNEEDLSKHFILLNQTKLSIKEIQQIWRAIKYITQFRSKVSKSALEIARKAGWDDHVVEIETRVTTAIAALEDAGYLKRGQNMPRIFASSILSKNAQEAIGKINASEKFEEKQKQQAVRIIKKLFSSKSRKQSNEEAAESRIDYISDHLGIVKAEVINIVNLLREEKILADTKDLTAFIKKSSSKNKSLKIVITYNHIENFLLPLMEQEEKNYHIKKLNEEAEEKGYKNITPRKIKTIINFWSIKNWIKRKNLPDPNNHIAVRSLHSQESLREKLEKRHKLSSFIAEYLHDKSNLNVSSEYAAKEEVLVEFSVQELKEKYEKQNALLELNIKLTDIEDALFYLSRIEAIKIEGGFLVVYNPLTIERLEEDNRKRYTKYDYRRLDQFYQNKVQQIHIVGEYAKKMINDYRDALQFVEDYFQLNYSLFLSKYYPGSKANGLKLKVTERKFQQLFGELSPTQLKIINDNQTQYIVVAAGPGSGKTRILVHKLAALLLMEDVKHEQLLMLTFSRAAATEFKKRLLKLIGNAANFIEIKTFHSYCFDLLGKVGTLGKSDEILKETMDKIKQNEVETNRITKTVLVIDEAQDMDKDEFALIKVLMQQNEEMKVIAVGDDDQNIYEFRGSSSEYFKKFFQVKNSTKYELIENYRSKSNLVDFSNQFVKTIQHRLKEANITPIQKDKGQIKIVRYRSAHLITPLVQDLLRAELTGTSCVLTRTNKEALQITGLLLKEGRQAQLIQTNDGFNLYHLFEVRFFLNQLNLADDVFIIGDKIWDSAKRSLINRFQHSTKLEICKNIIRDFEATNPQKKYKSDLELFIRESKMEDFFNENGETVFVSTIHKVKGKEFNNVFLLLEGFNHVTDEAKRTLYVAMTRAKNVLRIHLNGDYLDNLSAENLTFIENKETFSAPKEWAMNLTFKDLWLDYFLSKQHWIAALSSGDPLILSGYECLNSKGQPILKFSKQCIKKIETVRQAGYDLKSAEVNFMVYWLKEGSEQEVLIILPELYFEKQQKREIEINRI